MSQLMPAIDATRRSEQPGGQGAVRLVLLAAVVLAAGDCASTSPDAATPATVQLPRASSVLGRLYAVEELHRDFRKFRTILERKTVGLYTDRARLTAMLDEAEVVLAESMTGPMTELQFYRLLAPIIAGLRCGHSFLSVSAEMEGHLRTEALFFPLGVRIFGDRLFVVEDGHGLGVPPGSEILVLNGKVAAGLIQLICSNAVTVGRDHGHPRRDAELWFASLYYSYVDTPDRFALELLPPELPAGLPAESDTAVTMEIPAVRDARLAKLAQAIVYDMVSAPYPRAFQEHHAVLTITTFSYRKPKAYYAFLKDFFAELSARQLDTLILDLRGNYGGSPAPTAELFKYLFDKPIPFLPGTTRSTWHPGRNLRNPRSRPSTVLCMCWSMRRLSP